MIIYKFLNVVLRHLIQMLSQIYIWRLNKKKNNFNKVAQCTVLSTRNIDVNYIIMLIRNFRTIYVNQKSEGLCNGTRLIIIKLTNYSLKCKILMGQNRRY